MKKNFLLVSALLAGGFMTALSSHAQTKEVTLTTAKAVGEKMTLMVNKTYNGVTVDWGDGNTVTYNTGDDVFRVIEGTVKGSNIVITGDVAWGALSCANCEITAIDLSKARDLRSLYCQNNQLKTLDLKGMTSLTDLDCSNNQLTELVFTNPVNPEQDTPLMENYNISNNQLQGYTQGSTKQAFAMRSESLQHANVSNNNFKVAYFIANTKLSSLNISNNSLTSLSLQNNINLSTLLCHDNDITRLVLPKDHSAAMKQMFCDNNEVTSIDLSAASELTDLSCASNQLTELTLSPDAKHIETLNVSDNSLGIHVLPNDNGDLRSLSFEPQGRIDISAASGIIMKNNVPTVPVISNWSDRSKNPLDMNPYIVLSGGTRRDGKVVWYSVDEEGNTTELVQGKSASAVNDFAVSSNKYAFFTAHKKAYAEITSTKYDVKVQTIPIVIGDDITGIESIITNNATSVDVYDLRGRLVKKGATNFDGLQKGIYIVNGKKNVL